MFYHRVKSMRQVEETTDEMNDSLVEDINVANEVENYITAASPALAGVLPTPNNTTTVTFTGLPAITNIVLYDKKTMKSATQIEKETRIQDEDEKEEMILKAARHVQTAKDQRKYANEKIRLAVSSHNTPIAEQDNSSYCQIDTIICDFCQNMGLPQLGEHQAGATYYFSPLTVNCFGIADVSLTEPRLAAYVYHKGKGKKGGNNVVSLIMNTHPRHEEGQR